MKPKSIIQAAPMPTNTLSRVRYSLLDEALTNLRRVLEGGEPLTAAQKKIVCDIADLTRHHVVRRTLTPEQIGVAVHLRALRPAVVPGTLAVLDRVQASGWHNEVYRHMQELGIKEGEETTVFCDIAGVAS